MSTQRNERINNAIYDELGDRWHTATDDPVALLRAESRARNPWILARIDSEFGGNTCTVLDVACGAGFLSNELARAGHSVIGVDLSSESLEVAQRHDSTSAVRYLVMDAHRLGFEDAHFDVVCSMDFLEHTPTPGQAVREAARVLRTGGLYFFHTFNRTPLSGLIVIKGVEWFVANTPRHLHVYDFFIRPGELREMLTQSGFEVLEMRGLRPRFFSRAFVRMLLTRQVPDELEFVFTRSLLTGYTGVARRRR